jgi:hypothetical protein
MITELPAYATDATQNLTKVQKCQNPKGWNFGKKPTGELLPSYLNGACYIPEFKNMTLELVTIQKMLYEVQK